MQLRHLNYSMTLLHGCLLFRQAAIKTIVLAGLMLLLLSFHLLAYAADVTAINEAGNTIATTVDGDVGLSANPPNQGDNGTAINRGSITTSGNQRPDPAGSTRSFVTADGIQVYTNDGIAQATNEASGSVVTSGAGATGMTAYDGGNGTVIVTNSGSISTSGGAFITYDPNSDITFVDSAGGVNAGSANGTAQAVNEQGASIRTEGVGAGGLAANGGAGATAINRGSIVTTGDAFGEYDTNSGATYSARAYGIQVNSDNGNAQATNEAGATVKTEGRGARGITISSNSTQGTAIGINSGTIETSGDTYLVGGNSDPREPDGLSVGSYSGSGKAQAINEASGQITTAGTGGRGLNAVISSASGELGGAAVSIAEAINRGSITTMGNGFSGSSYAKAYGISTYNGVGGLAQSINEAGATITTTGTGARGVRAYGDQGGTAISTNRGTVTTRGGLFIYQESPDTADGVNAGSYDGLARATNEAGGVILTEGIGARGLVANNNGFSGSAEAENWGEITTTGDHTEAFLVRRRHGHGIQAYSEYNSAYAVNHADATVTTNGRGASGVYASAEKGGPDVSAIGVNHGTIMINGGLIHNETDFCTAQGIIAFADGEGQAQAINGYSGVIETTAGATGARGILTATYGGGAAQSINRGLITTRGDVYRIDRDGTENDTWRGAHGIGAYAYRSDATSTNVAGGVVATHGTAAHGMAAWSDGGNAKAVNQGLITTHQTQGVNDLPANEFSGDEGETIGARGVFVFSKTGNAIIENEATGRVETVGERAYALLARTTADGSRTSGMAEVRNQGQAITAGLNADAVVAHATNGGTATNPNFARVYNDLGAVITTTGNQSSGLAAAIEVNGEGSATAITAYGSALAQNDGTITTSGGSGSDGAGVFAANGIAAGFFVASGDTTTSVVSAGDAAVINTGDVTVNGANATGLLSHTYGSGNAKITMTGGSVTAGHASGIGIWAQSGDSGTIEATISDGAIVTATTTAARFSGGAAVVSLLNSTLNGDVEFGDANDRFTLTGGVIRGDLSLGDGDDSLTLDASGYISGAVDFGDGDDELVYDVRGDTGGIISGAITNLETMIKRGSGDALVSSAAFTGSHVQIEEGRLVVSGHLNVGASGTVEIEDAAQLTALIADSDNLPQITAGGGITFNSDAAIYMQATSSALGSDQALIQQAANNLLAPNTPTNAAGSITLMTTDTAGTTTIGNIPTAGGVAQAASASVNDDANLGVDSIASELPVILTPTDPVSSSGGGGGSSSGALFAVGGGAALAALLANYFDWFDWSDPDDEEASSEGWRSNQDKSLLGALTAAADQSHSRRTTLNGLQFWSTTHRNNSSTFAGGSVARLQGLALGVNAPLGNGFRIGFSALPTITVSLSNGVGVKSAGLRGERYAVRGGWSGEQLFVDADFSYGSYQARSLFDNTVGGGSLSGSFGMTHEHAQIGVGAHLGIAGIRAIPRVSVFGGSIKQAAHRATGDALQADIAGLEQSYYGWKASMSLTSAQWFNHAGTMRWRPNVHLSAVATSSRGVSVTQVQQSDVTGVLSFTSAAHVNKLPPTIFGFGSSIDAVLSNRLNLRLGYVSMIADDALDHAVIAGLRFRF